MKIGVFGGTFDPPHLGHLIAAGDAHGLLGLDRVIWIPSAVPPHKPHPRTSAELRLEMVRAAVDGDERFAVDDLELRRTGPSYTVHTLFALRREGVELVLLLGADALVDLPGWKDPDQIAELARLAVLARGPAGVPRSKFPAIPVQVTRVDISATEIRRRVRTGISIRNLVNDPVRRIVERERLYIAT